jgi:hypothetical protein
MAEEDWGVHLATRHDAKIYPDRAETSDLSIEWRKERAGGNFSRFSAPMAV